MNTDAAAQSVFVEVGPSACARIRRGSRLIDCGPSAYIAAVASYIRWYIPHEDMWCYAELDETRWVLRHVEQRERDDVFFAAASLAEELHARDVEGLDALRAYHGTYGATPESSIDVTLERSGESRFAEIAADYFEQIWQEARRARESGWGVCPL